MCLSSIQDEIEEVIEFSRKYLPISTSNYRIIWFKLHTCSDSDKRPNLLILTELIFSLPFSNNHVEQIFSSLGIIKTKRRTNLSTTTLQDLLEIVVEGPPVTTFDSDPAVKLWWREFHTTRGLIRNLVKHTDLERRIQSQKMICLMVKVVQMKKNLALSNKINGLGLRL